MRYCFTFAFAFVFAAIISAQAGALDLSFDPGQGANGPVYTVALQQDGKILIGGGFTTYDGEGRNGIARLTSNGALDPTFDPQFGFGNGAVSRLAIQSDGKVIAIGSFTTYNGVGRNRIARLNSDGGLDISYNPDIAFSFDPIAIALQPDGKALVHASVDGSARLLRLNGDGSSDGSFTAPAWGQLDKVYSIRILPDGKILMAGCTVSSGTLSSQARISRLHANGSLDESFDSGVAGVDWQQSPGTCICDVSVLGSGEILVAGRFDTFNGSPRRAIVRLLPDGSVDNGWSSDHPAPSTIRTVLVQPSGGKIVSFGDYSTALFAIPGLGVALSQVNDIARLTEDGAQDDAFDSATEVVDVYYMALQTDGKILIVGDFSSYNGVPRSRIARLLGDPSGVGLGETLPRKFGDLLLFPNPSDGQLKLHLELTGLVYIQVFDPLGRQVHNEVFQASGAKTVRTLDLSELAKGCYTLVAKNDQGTVSQRVVLE